jgi:hypothetical protein
LDGKTRPPLHGQDPAYTTAIVRIAERASKTAATTSVLLIVLLMLAVHPDMTWPLRVAGLVALAGGWLAATRFPSHVQVWLIAAAIAPAFLRLIAGREGPVLDVVWMAGLAGALLRVSPWSQWRLPAPWNVLIGGWALALSLAWPVLVAREIGFRVAGFYDFGAVNSWSLLSAPQSAAWTQYVVLTQLLGALWFERAREAWGELRVRMKVLDSLWIGATGASLVAIVQGVVDLGFLSTPFWEAERRATGTMLDANSYGMCAALAAPIGFLGMRSLAPRVPAAAVAVFFVNIAGMWLSGSRTAALLSGSIGAVSLIVGLWSERRTGTSAPTPAVAISAGVLALVAVLLVSGTANPIQRALDIPLSRAGLVKLWSRDGYGPIALQMTREYPLTGVGVGSYRVLAPDYWRAMANDSLPLDNAQNWWRHQFAELGVFGGALIILFSVLVGWRVLIRRPLVDGAEPTTVRGVLLGLGATSLFGMPTQNPLVLCWFFGLAACVSRLLPDAVDRDERPRDMRVAWVVACAFAIAYAVGHVVLAAGPLNVVQRAQRAQRNYLRGAHAPEPLPGANEFHWTRQDAHLFWAVKTRWMVIRFWASHPDIAARPVHVTLTSPCGVLFDEDLTSPESMSLGMALPEGRKTMEATVHVSRTWKPSDVGEADDRELGVGIVADFSNDPAVVTSQLRTVKLPDCGGGL